MRRAPRAGVGQRGVLATIARLAGDQVVELRRALVLRAGQAILAAVPVGVVVSVIDRVRTGTLTTPGIALATAVVAGALAGQWALGLLANRCAWITTFAVFGRVRHDAVAHLRRLPLAAHQGRRVGDTVTALTQDVNAVEVFVHEPLQIIVAAAVTPTVVIAGLVVLDPALALATAASVAVALPVFAGASRRFTALAARRQRLQADASARMLEYVQGMPVVRSHGLAGARLAAFHGALDRYRAANSRLAVQLAPLVLAAVTVIELGVPLVIGLGGTWVLGGHLDTGTLVVFLVLVARVHQPLLQAVGAAESLRLAGASLDRLARILDEPAQLRPGRPTASVPARPDVAVDHVTFGYDPARPVLHDVSFTVPAGSMTAIVGPSGAGKSTILSLAAGFWDPDRGSVRLGGVATRDLTAAQLFDTVTLVSQDVYLFPGSVAENIAFGAGASVDRVEAAARAAHAHDFITALPHGYDTTVAEAGANLSGGERQRIAIARAILKDAPVVLLDEATSSIDPTGERRVQEAFGALAADRTVIVVAHRLATIAGADQILVMHSGRIVERGSHGDLLAGDGLYRHLWDQRRRAATWRVRTSSPSRPGPSGTGTGTGTGNEVIGHRADPPLARKPVSGDDPVNI